MTEIRFCRSFDGVRLAHAHSGRGPAMVEVATWLNHLEHDWNSPVWGPRLAELTAHYTLTRYDGRGCGLSEREVKDLTFDACLGDLEAVVNAAGLKQFILLGCCQGTGLAIAYAARHPDRVSHLILYGAFARGRLKRNPSPQDIDEANTMLKLVELGWGHDNSAFRQVYTTLFIPESKPEQYRWFSEMQRLSTSAENAVGLIRGFDAMDVTDQMSEVRSPTFRPLAELVPGIQPRVRQDLVTVTHPFWSGAVVHATGSQKFTWVLGQWNVPDVTPAATGQGSWYSLAWIGIDGTSDVTQIGTVQSVSADASGNLIKNCYAILEWWPQGWQAIANFPVSFGDTLLGLICLDSPTEAWFSLLNLTRRTHAGSVFTAPAGTSSLENQAEWIFERPGVSGASVSPPNFGEIYFDSAQGGHGLDFLADAGTDTAINMVVNGITVATTTVETPTLIKIAYTGP